MSTTERLWYVKTPTCRHIITDNPEQFYPEDEQVTPNESAKWNSMPLFDDSWDTAKFWRWIENVERQGESCIVLTKGFEYWSDETEAAITPLEVEYEHGPTCPCETCLEVF